MEKTKELREKVLDMARALTPIGDMAVLLDMSVGQVRDLLADDQPLGREYRRTIAEIAMSVRKNDIELAQAGSPTASEHVATYLERIYSDGL